MDKYIKLDDAIAALKKDVMGGLNYENILKKIPAADVQPVKHGRWISVGHKLSRICSVCDCDEPYKFADLYSDVYDFCPHCGAKMDGEE